MEIFETSSHIDEIMVWNIRLLKLLNLRVKGIVCSVYVGSVDWPKNPLIWLLIPLSHKNSDWSVKNSFQSLGTCWDNYWILLIPSCVNVRHWGNGTRALRGPLGKLTLPPYRGVKKLGIILCPRILFPQVWLFLDYC